MTQQSWKTIDVVYLRNGMVDDVKRGLNAYKIIVVVDNTGGGVDYACGWIREFHNVKLIEVDHVVTDAEDEQPHESLTDRVERAQQLALGAQTRNQRAAVAVFVDRNWATEKAEKCCAGKRRKPAYTNTSRFAPPRRTAVMR
jgi:hypothetical protein